MPRETYGRELQHLHDDVLALASMVDSAVERSIDALRERNVVEARQIIQEDTLIDRKRFDIEERAIRLIATQQPIASDLRSIVAALHIIIELERIGDYAEGICKINLMHGDQPLLKPLIDIPRMADKARSMLREALDAFVAHDAKRAKQVADDDDEVDALYDQVYRELLTYMIADPSSLERATWLLWVAHNLERIADRVTNICERVVYEVTGRLDDMNVSKY